MTGVSKSITEFPGLKFDVIVDFVGFGNTTAQAVATIRRDGTVLLVGMGKLDSTINEAPMLACQGDQ